MNNASILTFPISINRHFSLGRWFGLKFVWIITIVLLVSLFLFYIFQTNAIIAKTYLIGDYEKKIELLSKENKSLEINLAQVNSLANIENLIKERGFERIEKIHYIQVLNTAIVSK